MASPINRLCNAASMFFLSQDSIIEKIQNRLTRGVSEDRIAAQENPQSTVPSTQGLFVEFDWAGHSRELLLGGAKGGLPIGRMSFRFFARYIDQATALYDAFHDAMGTDGRYSGTWAANTPNETIILGARWDDESVNDSRDEAISMCYLQAELVIPFKS